MRKQPVVLIAVAIVTMGVTSLFAQAAPLASDDLLRVLIEEIRTLRLSLQKSSAYEIRGRLLLDRARLQQETIRDLQREVDAYAESLRNSETESETMYDIETTMVAAAVPGPASAEDQRRMAQQQKEVMERRKQIEARHREQMRVRYQRMETRLNDERDKLRAIEDELAEMQKDLMK